MELNRIRLVLQDYTKAPEIENFVTLVFLECIRDGAVYIEDNSNDYPQNSINGKIWMDGIGLRTKAEELFEYFKKKEDDQNTLAAVFFKSKTYQYYNELLF